MKAVSFLLARFSEPSSYAGLGAILALLGINVPDSTVSMLIQTLAGACGLAALVMKERQAHVQIAAPAAADAQR